MKKLFLTGVFLLSILVSFSAIITVSSTADAGAGTLRDAIASAMPGDEIEFSFATPDSIVLISNLTIDKNLTITGPGPDLLKIAAGSNSARTGLLTIQSGFQVNISGLTFSGATSGPAIKNTGSTLLLENCRISNNSQGLYNGGWATPSNTSKATLNNCEVINNIGTGGIYNQGANGDSSILTLNYCLVKGNSNTFASDATGGGIRNTTLDGFGAIKGIGICYIKNSSIVENSAIGRGAIGGGIASFNGGPMIGGTTLLHMENTTVSGNRCEATASNGNVSGGGIACFVDDIGEELSMLNMSHCTIANNHISGTRFIGAAGIEMGSMFTTQAPIFIMQHSIISGNTSSPTQQGGLDVSASFIASQSDNNLIRIGARIPGPLLPYVGTTGVPLDLKLCPLGMNGGLLPTHGLVEGSPAIDAATSTTFLTDQRDSARIGLPDIGAFEFNPNVIATHTLSGTISQSNGTPLPNTEVFLISFDKTDSSLTSVATTMSNASGGYSFQAIGPREYFVKAAPDSALYPMEIPSYYDSAVVFQEAKGIALCEDTQVDFKTISGSNPGGPGFLGGKITQGANKKTGESLEGIRILLVDSVSMKVTAYADTDNNGNFVFPNLALGTYEVWVDQPFIDNGLAPTFTLTSQDASLSKLKFELQSTKLEWVGVVEGIDPANLWDENSYSLYPNPASKTVSFKWDANTFGENVEIKLYEATGKLVKQVYVNESGQLQIPLHNLSAGLYLYSVSHRDEIKAIGKLMVR